MNNLTEFELNAALRKVANEEETEQPKTMRKLIDGVVAPIGAAAIGAGAATINAVSNLKYTERNKDVR